MVLDFPETPHQTRDNTDFPRPLRKSEARLRLACPPPPLAWRNGAPHERGAGGESDPPFLGAGAARGRAKGDGGRDTLCPPLRGGRSHHSDPYGKAEDLSPGCPAQPGFATAGLRASGSGKTTPCLATSRLSMLGFICPRNRGRYK